MSLFDSGQIILVTGASSGLGRACALALVENGATVLASGRNPERLEQARATSANPNLWHNEVFDLASEIEAIPAFVTSLRKKYGQLYGLLNSAGEARLDSVAAFELDVARRHFDLNYFAPLQLAKGFLDRRNCPKNGSMLFIASIAGVFSEKGHAIYGAAKAALISSVKAISQEAINRNIRANCISPASILTPMLERALAEMGEAYLEKERSRYPLGFGKPEDVAHLACFLLSHKAAWITGQNFIMDGGAF